MSTNFDTAELFANNGRTIYNASATCDRGGTFANEGTTIYSPTRSNREARTTRTARTDATTKASGYRVNKKASQRPRGTPMHAAAPWGYGRIGEYALPSVPAHGHTIGLRSPSTSAAKPPLAAGAEDVDARDRRSEAAAALLSMSMGTGANTPSRNSRNPEHESNYDSDRTYQGSNACSDTYQTASGHLLQAQPTSKFKSVSLGNCNSKSKSKAKSEYAETSKEFDTEHEADIPRFSKGGWASRDGSGGGTWNPACRWCDAKMGVWLPRPPGPDEVRVYMKRHDETCATMART